MGGRKMKENQGEHPFGDKGQIILFVVFLIVWFADSFIFKISTFLAASVPLLGRVVISLLVLVLAVRLVQLGHAVIDHGHPADSLVSSGAFGYVRHPLYLGSMLFYLALVLATLSVFSAVIFIFIFLFYNFIAGYEEKLLLQKFGDAYQAYMKHTGRWIPRMGE
jgi:protein-S-isoprenylcysteine O-methyltransferase Ste14